MKKLGRQLIASNKKQKSCVGRDLEKAILKKENFYFKREVIEISNKIILIKI